MTAKARGNGSRLARARRGVGFAIAGVVAAVAVANGWVLATGGSRVVTPDRVRHAPVAIVFGAGVRADGTVSAILEDRLLAAVDLYARGVVDTLLLTGDHSNDDYDEVDAMKRFVVARGVPAPAVAIDPHGVDTFSSVARARRVYGYDRAVLVSQAYHLPRALFLAERVGIDCEGVAADRRAYRSMLWFRSREILSRVKAIVDWTLGRSPRLDP